MIYVRIGSKYASDYGKTQKQSFTGVLKIFEVLICNFLIFKIKAKLLLMTWDNVRF